LDFGDVETGTTIEQNYTVEGSDLTDDITLTAPTGYEISLTSGSDFTTSLILTQTGGTVATTTIYVKFAPVSAISYTSDITHESVGATTANVSVTGNGICTNLTVTGPGNKTKCEGGNAIFTVSVTGTETITYVWKKGTVILNNGGDISGANTNSISIANIKPADAGNYICEVTDACSNTEIGEGILTVTSVVNITADPSSLTKCEGEQAQFTVSATGGGLSYQWKNGSTNVGANSSTYTITSVTVSDAGNYSCVVSGTCGNPVTSNIATLTVNEGITITTQPVGGSVCEGSSKIFIVSATGSATISYQWEKDGNIINGENTSSYNLSSITVSDEGTYTCDIANSCGIVTTNQAVLTVNTNSTVDLGADQSVCDGETVTLNAGGGFDTYLWSTGETTQSIDVTSSGTYSVVVTDANGCGEGTDEVIVTIYPLPIVNIGNDTTIYNNETITLDAGSEFIEYLWNDGSNMQTLIVDGSQLDTVSYSYSVTVNDSLYCSNSDTIVITIKNYVGILSINASSSIIKVYPNPATDLINLSIANVGMDKIVVNIISSKGHILYLKEFSNIKEELIEEIDLSNYTSGIYFIKVYNDKFSKTERLVIE
ncbi:MAG: immunoglobulin domain-containing protein, partial [Bacteroidales bacterium]|nr:immunoglobulin domain-containing protein [Bacteroidales bacterium]